MGSHIQGDLPQKPFWRVDNTDMRDYGEGELVAIRNERQELVALVRPEDAKWIVRLNEVAKVFQGE